MSDFAFFVLGIFSTLGAQVLFAGVYFYLKNNREKLEKKITLLRAVQKQK